MLSDFTGKTTLYYKCIIGIWDNKAFFVMVYAWQTPMQRIIGKVEYIITHDCLSLQLRRVQKHNRHNSLVLHPDSF